MGLSIDVMPHDPLSTVHACVLTGPRAWLVGSVLLGGVVRTEDGVPMSHAFIPVLGDDGRQLLTTRTDDQGRCVAADLPEELAVVGHLPAHLDGSGADLGSAAA